MEILGKYFRECSCEEIDSCYTIPATSFFKPKELENQNQNFRFRFCKTCKGYAISEAENFEPSVYDLPQKLFNAVYLRTGTWKNQNLRHIAQEIPKTEFLNFRNVGETKVEQLNTIFKSYGIKWKKK